MVEIIYHTYNSKIYASENCTISTEELSEPITVYIQDQRLKKIYILDLY